MPEFRNCAAIVSSAARTLPLDQTVASFSKWDYVFSIDRTLADSEPEPEAALLGLASLERMAFLNRTQGPSGLEADGVIALRCNGARDQHENPRVVGKEIQGGSGRSSGSRGEGRGAVAAFMLPLGCACSLKDIFRGLGSIDSSEQLLMKDGAAGASDGCQPVVVRIPRLAGAILGWDGEERVGYLRARHTGIWAVSTSRRSQTM